MEYLINFLNTLLPILYFISTFLYAKSFYRQDEWAENSKGAALKITAVVHLVEILLRGIHYQHHPILSIYEAASFLALSIVLIYLYLEFRLPIKTTGYFTIFSFLCSFCSSSHRVLSL